jgi:hypothetical protein
MGRRGGAGEEEGKLLVRIGYFGLKAGWRVIGVFSRLPRFRWESFPFCSRAWPQQKTSPFAARGYGAPEGGRGRSDKKKQSFVVS